MFPLSPRGLARETGLVCATRLACVVMLVCEDVCSGTGTVVSGMASPEGTIVSISIRSVRHVGKDRVSCMGPYLARIFS